jgi:hypothetical protein
MASFLEVKGGLAGWFARASVAGWSGGDRGRGNDNTRERGGIL